LNKIAVLIPCFNEERTVSSVIAGFQKALPEAQVYVYDNNSSDNTATTAAAAGAIVRTETLQGKGNVVRRMFADIDASVYILVDGDATYDPSVATQLVSMILAGYDFVNVARESVSNRAYRAGHEFGNWLLTSMVAWFFGRQTSDMLSGYKAFSRRFVKSFPAISPGFEIETELTIHALELRVAIGETRAPYGERPEGSHSKLSTFRDGYRIARMIGSFVKNERPLLFFNAISLALIVGSCLLATPIVLEYLVTGLVPRFPTAILATGMVLLAGITWAAGLILDTITLGRKENKRLKYLEYSATDRND
jgi:glycosyltransferase involved in cell wall biosynthesis